MPLIVLIATLVALRLLEVWRFAQLSWGWIIGLMVLGFVWFEFIEPMLGLDKKKEHTDEGRRRRERVEKIFGKRK